MNCSLNNNTTTKSEKEWINTEGEGKTNPFREKRVWLDGNRVDRLVRFVFFGIQAIMKLMNTKGKESVPTCSKVDHKKNEASQRDSIGTEDALLDGEGTTEQREQ